MWGRGASSDQLGVLGCGSQLWGAGVSLCFLGDFCQRPASLGVTHLEVALFPCLLGEGRAIWGRDVLLTLLHTPLQCFSLLRIGTDLSAPVLPPEVAQPAPLQLFSSFSSPAQTWGWGCQSCRWRAGAHSGLKTFLDSSGGWGGADPTCEMNSTVIRNSLRAGRCSTSTTAWAFGTGDHSPLCFSFLFAVLVCQGTCNKVPPTGGLNRSILPHRAGAWKFKMKGLVLCKGGEGEPAPYPSLSFW